MANVGPVLGITPKPVHPDYYDKKSHVQEAKKTHIAV